MSKNVNCFDYSRQGLACWLGPTEAELMAYLWEQTGPRGLTRIHAATGQGRALTTTQTTLNRLCAKGLLTRTGGAYSFVYAAAEPREAWEARQVAMLLSALVEAVGVEMVEESLGAVVC